MTGLRIMNEIMDPATSRERAGASTFFQRRAGRRRRCTEPLAILTDDLRSPKVRTGYPDSAGALSRPPGPRRPESDGGVELHQSVHALWPAPRLQGQFRKAADSSATTKALELFHHVEEVKQ